MTLVRQELATVLVTCGMRPHTDPMTPSALKRTVVPFTIAMHLRRRHRRCEAHAPATMAPQLGRRQYPHVASRPLRNPVLKAPAVLVSEGID